MEYITLNNRIVKALIIDDETDICYLLSRILQRRNLDTSYVNCLKDATDALQTNHPEIIFLDNHLPDGLGMNYISYIKEQSPLSKVIMITAHDSSDDREKAIANGADFFIGKPFSGAVIHNALETLV